MQYDGTTSLTDAVADLLGLSKKSQAIIARRNKAAKTALGITSKSKKLPPDINLSIYRWHADNLSAVQDVKQLNDISPTPMPDNDVQDIKQELLQGIAVQDIKQADDVQLHHDTIQDIKRTDSGNQESLSETGVYDVKQADTVQDVKSVDDGSASSNAVYDFKQIHFAVSLGSKRTTTMLEAYLVKALQHKHGLIDNTAVRVWIEQAITGDARRFDSYAPLTRQIKRLIIESLI